jgi:hypothetical protein
MPSERRAANGFNRSNKNEEERMPTVQEERLARRFKLWDKDGDGKIGLADYQAEVKRVASAFGESENSPKAKAAMDAVTALWPDPSKVPGLPGGVGGMIGGVAAQAQSLTQLNVDQFTAVVNSVLLAPGEGAYDTFLAPYIRALASLCDTDGDGQVNAEDYSRGATAMGIDGSVANATFSNLDADGDGKVSVDAIVDAVRDFHFGKPNAPEFFG